MNNLISALILVTSSIVAGQRPSFAGLSPIGFPTTPNRTTTTPDPLADRFGEPEALPIEANGDRDLIDRLSKLPLDKQPFWFINWQAYDKHRKEPQTFAQKPNSFVDPIPLSNNSGQVNNGLSTPNPGVTTQPNLFNRFAPTSVSSQPDDASRNFNSNANLNNGGFVYPTSNVNPISHILPTNAYDNSNVYTSSNSNSNTYPNSNSNTYPNSNSNSNTYPNSNSNTYPNSNSNSNTYPNSNSNSNTYPNSNSNSNTYPNSNSNSNTYPNSNSNWSASPAGNPAPLFYPNIYPAGNTNPNTYPAGNINPNTYPAGNVYPNTYPTGYFNPNSNQYQTSTFNSNLNTGTVNKNSTFIQTTQKYQWTSNFKTTKVVPTTFKGYPETYPRTDTYSQLLPGHDSYYNNY